MTAGFPIPRPQAGAADHAEFRRRPRANNWQVVNGKGNPMEYPVAPRARATP